MRFGLAQGGVTSPIFYNIYTADIPKHDKCILALFADDTSILCTSQFLKPIINGLQQYLDILKKYYRRWKISINAEKTRAWNPWKGSVLGSVLLGFLGSGSILGSNFQFGFGFRFQNFQNPGSGFGSRF
jgi:hypothetical protein